VKGGDSKLLAARTCHALARDLPPGPAVVLARVVAWTGAH
jgi:hypothetical protein